MSVSIQVFQTNSILGFAIHSQHENCSPHQCHFLWTKEPCYWINLCNLKGDTCTSFNVFIMLIVHWCIIFIWSKLSYYALNLRCFVHCMPTTLSLEKVHDHINFIYFINTQWIPCFQSSLTNLLSLEHKFSHPIVWHLTIMSCACCCKLHKLVINQFASTMSKVL